ncbi:MAG: DUF4826 family protein [Pseudomonadota bacterium]
MTETTNGQDEQRDAFIRWVREQHSQMGQYAAGRGLIGEDAEGRPIWSIPHQVYLGRFYDKAEPDAGYWYIAGDLPSDHVPASVAETAREAVRHFALKWQLQAAQIEQGKGGEDGPVVDFANAAGNLSRSAEALLACVDNDALWEGVVNDPSPGAETT